MTTYSETGNAKNTANLRKLITACQGYGAKYNPARTELTITALLTQADTCDAALQAVRNAVQAEKDAINNRNLVFKALGKLATRIINGLAAYNSPANVLDNARSLVSQLSGKRVGKVKAGKDGADAPTISVSKMSYDMRVDTFDKIVALVATQINYIPNEVEMQLTALQAHAQSLRNLNQAALDTQNIAQNARINRDKIMYSDADCLFDIASNVKNYVKYLYGATSPEFKQIRGINFINQASK